MSDLVVNSGLNGEEKKKPNNEKSTTSAKKAKKNGSSKKKGKVFTVNKSYIVEDQDKISRLALTLGMSYSQARQYSHEVATRNSSKYTIRKKKPANEIRMISEGVNSRSSDTGMRGINKDKESIPRISLKEYSVFCLVNDDKKLEGLVIAFPSRLYDGYFFVSDKSALSFIASEARDANNIQDVILDTRKKLRIKNNGKGTVNYVSEKGGNPSVAQRRMLCKYLTDALEQNASNMTTGELVAHVFRKEKRLLQDQLSEFVSNRLYLRENENLVGEYKKEADSAKRKDVIEPPVQKVSMENRFYDGGVLMEGTRECAKLVLYPPNKAMMEYSIPEYVDTICTGAFKKTNKLETIKLGRNVKTIEKEAFVDNTSLASITIPKNVEVVEEGAFTRCHNLIFAFVSSKSSHVSLGLFIDCRRLRSLVTTNESLKNGIEAIRTFSKSEVELKIHKEGTVSDYPFLNHSDKIIVMGNIYNCLKQGHKIKTLWVNVPIRENGIYKAAPICVFQCKRCKRKFILPDVYEYYLMRYDFANTKLFVPIEYSSWYTGYRMGLTDISGLQPMGVLKEIGYSVSDAVGLSSTSRINILKSVIELGILTKAEVEQYLEFFINYIGSQDRMASACAKWKSDLTKIHDMLFKGIKYSEG